MGIWSFFFGNKLPDLPASHFTPLTEAEPADHLGRAATAKQRGKAAVAQKRYHDAWRHFHEQKEHYLRQARRYGMTAQQTLALDGSVHEDLANIRRLEGNHDEALVHLLYCVSSSPRPTKAQLKKIFSYFSRCGFGRVNSDELSAYLANPRNSDFVTARTCVAAWRARE